MKRLVARTRIPDNPLALYLGVGFKFGFTDSHLRTNKGRLTPGVDILS